ncbi:MAG: B12-binding domain-containing radical SAM protein [Methylovirgula sp.]
MTNVLLVFPSFNPNSFWSFQGACEVSGAHWPAPPLGLITVAALLPQIWTFRLVDKNVDIQTEADWAWADLVMTGGMLPQRLDILATIQSAKARGKPICVGGPDPTSSPEVYANADFLVLGEAEGIIADFVAAWESGARSGRFEAEKFKADVTASPLPRYDLLTFKNYLYVGLQFSRGCPFNCEFCDIIELYGQVPRTKTNAQMLRELDRLYELGFRGHVDFVDDNLIGNKKALKLFLPALKTWQQQHNYPFKFSTEASINLADDPELLSMLRLANFFAVFIGVESPDTNTLIAMQKKQNTRRSLEESIFKIYSAGIFVLAGFIIGFDTEEDGVAAAMIDCIEATSIPVCMVGLLTALPNTQMTRRLEREGRLYPGFDEILPGRGDQCTAGLNFIPLRSRREILRDYKEVLENIYQAEAFFGRVSNAARALKGPALDIKPDVKAIVRDLIFFARLTWRLVAHEPKLCMPVWRSVLGCIRSNPGAIEYVLTMTVLYFHLGSFSSYVVVELERQIAAIDAGECDRPLTSSAA